MQLLRTMKTGQAADSDNCRTDNWPKGRAAVAIDLDCEWPVTVGKVGGYTPTAADLKALAAYFLGQVSVAYGAKGQHKPYIGVAGDKLRLFERIMSQSECWNDFVGVAKAAAAHIFRARIRLHVNRKLSKGARRFIGWTQGRTLAFDLREGTVFPAQGAALLSRTAGVNAVVRVMPVYRPGPDRFSHLPHYREVQSATQSINLPDGRTIAAWEATAAADATALGKFSVKVGDEELHTLLEPAYIARDYRSRIDAGGSDFLDEVTPFYVADPFEDEQRLPTGPVEVAMLAQDLGTFQGRALYLPVINDAEAATNVAEAAEARGEVVTATVPNVPTDGALNGHVAVSDIEYVGAQQVNASTTPGLRADQTGNVEVFVPAHAQAIARAAGSKELAARVEKVTALAIPGTHTTKGKSAVNASRSFVRSVFGAFR